MKISEKIQEAAMGVLGYVILASLIMLGISFFKGASWLITKIFPWLMPTFFWTSAICIFVLIPAALFRKTRFFAIGGFVIASSVFGFILWVWSFILTMELWGIFAVVLGLFLGGVGIIPVALLAALFHSDWSSVGDILLMTAAAMGSKLLAIWLGIKMGRDEGINNGGENIQTLNSDKSRIIDD